MQHRRDGQVSRATAVTVHRTPDIVEFSRSAAACG
jgi:hypothetical protein